MSSMPEGACDCHVHVIGARGSYPMLPNRPYTPAPASMQALREHMETIGVDRAVIVQPSIYGTDNRCLLDCLQAMPSVFRGVAVLGQETDDETLARLTASGVTGLRINLESTGADDLTQALATVRYWMNRLSGSGWHIQLYAGFDLLNRALEQLGKPALPLVIDHFGLVPPATTLDSLRSSPLIQGLENGDLYIKLSGSYRVGSPAEADQIVVIAQALLAANTERIVWASDWPHTNREPGKLPIEVSRYRDVPAQSLLTERANWLSDAALQRQVLVDNPARLYGF